MANGSYIANIGYSGSFATLNSAFLNNYYTPLERTRDDLGVSFFFGGLGGLGGYALNSTLTRNWISSIPQYITPQGYNPALGALLNSAPVINSQYVRFVLGRDIAVGFTGSGTEAGSNALWNMVNPK